MKIKATLIAAALLAANTASADFTVRITGATAFRASAVNALKNTMTFTGPGEGYAYNGTNFSGATTSIFKGKMAAFGSQVVTVKCTWSGSVAGIRALSGNTNGTPFNVTFYADDTTVTPGGTASAPAAKLTDVSQADFAFADNTQSSTIYTNNTLDSRNVGVVPFVVVASRDVPAAVTNVTSQLFQSLFATGRASAALFTNNPADASDQVTGTMLYAMGRDPFSGTRVVVQSETGLGTGSLVNQWVPTAGTANGTITEAVSVAPTAADSVTDSLNPIAAGNNGATSGGTLADYLRYKTTLITDTAAGLTTKAGFIAYMGETDADRAVNGTGSSVNGTGDVGCRYLSYNGVNAFGGKVYSLNTATTTAGSAVVTNIVTTGLVVGQFVRSTTGHLAADSVIVSIDSASQVTLSKNAVTSATAAANFSASNVLPEAIWNGKYTLWGYELMLKRASLTSGDKFTFFNNLATRIHDVDFFYAGLSESSLRVSRSEDGGTVTSKYIFPEE